MRLFALEYYRQMINSDHIHFTRANKKAQLRIKDHLSPFVCNNREAGKVAEEIIEHMRLNKSFGLRYDPRSFICDRRMKNKLSPYLYHKIPEIEQYANMNEWREGTLVERDNDQVNVENVMRYLEKRLNLDSFEQVPVGNSQKPTLGTCASTTDTSQRHSLETSAPLAEPSLGKEQGTSTPASGAIKHVKSA